MKSIAELIWDEEQKASDAIYHYSDKDNYNVYNLSHMNGVLRGLQIARDIAEKYERL